MAVIRTSALTQQAEEQLGHPVDLVSCFAARQEWYVRRMDRNMLTADVPGHWSHYHIQVTWQDYDETLRLDCGLELPVDDGAFQRLALVICLLNQHLFLGHFVIAPDTGAVELSYTLPLRGAGGATPEQIEDVVDIMLGECEHCFPAIFQVAGNQLSASDAAAAALFTTEGEA